ncbi:amino acid adenylation domain-containing protein [Whalleya microplaca]|nr:amino acid adenylation domain-containing protein [Whalleya microplaca]
MSRRQEPIAIIGTGCRFPGGADSPSKLWELLRNPRDLLTPIPVDRFSAHGFYHDNGQYHGHSNVKDSYLLGGDRAHRQFDAHFFGISQCEAQTMDPQLRLLLETVYEALERSGHSIESLRGSDTAVYSGLMRADYTQIMTRDGDYSTLGTYHETGTSRALMSNRVSYFFDWRGPSMTIDTACSSSLVAIHQAVVQLRSGQSRLAVATGANLLLDPMPYVSGTNLKLLSPDSRSRMWDASANGYARGEGIAAIVLKPLLAAEEDGDDIECIIRETAVNQDGRTNGITRPSAAAQKKLILDCYRLADLDPKDLAGRPQYFEAHGTGTPLGDPTEAEAIWSTFFSDVGQESHGLNPILVGSIKTAIGHTEGTAGLAGILKASLALQNAIIPPNLLLEELNDRIRPFYANLRVPTSATPWPNVSGPRRASVNSFGFGGCNAHAILENYEPVIRSQSLESAPLCTPLVFSAATDGSLFSYLDSFYKYMLGKGSNESIHDIAHTLYSRSRLPVAIVLAATTLPDLYTYLERSLSAPQAYKTIGIRTTPNQALGDIKILGVFTGQGAQWARQGYELIKYSPTARDIVMNLDTRLSQLPIEDRPSWSLLEELEKEACISLISQSSLSQPLCTAIQILQVDLLRLAGIQLSAVVGHSSGEIAAAYAAGVLSAQDAICIAYYRGIHSDLAGSSNGQPGAMMAVGVSVEDFYGLCDSSHLRGRVSVAAINSPVSITVSGDSDAIEELRVKFVNEKKFVKVLRIDKAYHSHHMVPCAQLYAQSLRALHIPISTARCAWFSSVTGEPVTASNEALSDAYWKDNLLEPVLFMKALQSAWDYMGPFNLALEIGPHPALKRPLQETFQAISAQPLPYTCMLYRGRNSIESFAEGLGSIWLHLGKEYLDLQAYDRLFSAQDRPVYSIVKDIPTYAWDHTKEYWHESRHAEAVRTRSDSVRTLLGHLNPDTTKLEMHWRQIVKPGEILWLDGHRLQNQMVFPAAGYIVMAIEAAMTLCKNASVTFIEVFDVEISKALTFDDVDIGVEAVFSLKDITRERSDIIEARFDYKATLGKHSDLLDLLASGHLRVSLGKGSDTVLPARGPCLPHLADVQAIDFYKSLERIGYQYSHPFNALYGLKRRLAAVTGLISNIEPGEFFIHPATLDAAFQSVLLARSAPGDGELRSIHVPKAIRRIGINPYLCAAKQSQESSLQFDTVQPVGSSKIEGDVDIYRTGLDCAMIQIEGLILAPLSVPTVREDREMFSTMIWDVASPDAQSAVHDDIVSGEQRQLATILERAAVLYLRNLDESFPSNHPLRTEGPYSHLLYFASHVVRTAQGGTHPLWRSEWESDTYEQISNECSPYQHVVDVRLLTTMGQSLYEIVKGTKLAIEVGMTDNLLNKYYEASQAVLAYTTYLARIVNQIAHRTPQMDIIEIGAGTAGATKRIFGEIGEKWSSYTFTDISPGFFDAARVLFSHKDQSQKMSFKVLDISKSPGAQAFAEHSYDLVVASMVLHATPSLRETLHNVRRLLKPGGYLVATEILAECPAYIGAIFGAFHGWWAGVNDGRVLSPGVSVAEWDSLLRSTGFSGCDTVTPSPDPSVRPVTVFVSQAMDDKLMSLREPFSVSELAAPGHLIDDLVLVGGNKLPTSRLVGQLQSILGLYCKSTHVLQSLECIRSLNVSYKTTVLCLEDLDEPFFQRLTDTKWEAIKATLSNAGSILWITHGRCVGNPYANLMVGLLRSSTREFPALDIQILNVADIRNLEARIIAETLLRLKVQILWRQAGIQDANFVTIEPEIVVDEKGRTTIPRMMANKGMNDRYNSFRRPIMASANLDTTNIVVRRSDNGLSLYNKRAFAEQEMGNESIRVSYSSHSPVRVAEVGCLFLMLGISCDSGAQLVVLSATHASVVHPFANIRVPTNLAFDSGSETKFLCLVAYHMLSSVILRGLTQRDNILVHEPDPIISTILTRDAKHANVDITFTTCQTVPRDSSWLRIHPQAPNRAMRNIIPQNLSVFVDFTELTGVKPGSSDRITSQIPTSCRRERLSTLFEQEARAPLNVSDVLGRLAAAVASAEVSLEDPPLNNIEVSTISPDDLVKSESCLTPQCLVDWATTPDVTIQVEPVDSQINFSGFKTYWLVGLTSGLGLSLCEWMVRHGARHVVLSSRSPDIDGSWLDNMRADGVDVHVFSCDITNRTEVESLHAEICLTLPPIGGVAQGAMVLEDMLLRDMPLETLEKVMRPKTEGSLHLHNLMQDGALEFFILFSSVITVTGNSGQSNYSAANIFMESLAEQRRQLGLAGSVINIGPILGVGYLAEGNSWSKGRERFKEMLLDDYTPLSERDFHQLFAEAVLAGRPSSSGPVCITAGLEKADSDRDVSRSWENNPIMGHIVQNHRVSQMVSTQPESEVPLRTQLAEVRTKDELRDIIRSALTGELCKMFQLDSDRLSQADLATFRMDEAGIDSLLATEIHGWFMKSLEVNIPTLKILSGITASELIDSAADTIPASLTPQLQLCSSSSSFEPNPMHLGYQSPTDESDRNTDIETSNETTSQMTVSSKSTDPNPIDDETHAIAARYMLETAEKLSFSQETFWSLSTFLADKTRLNHVISFRVTGMLRYGDLERALKSITQQHQSLRTCFFMKGNHLVQAVKESSMVHIQYRQINDDTEANDTVTELESYVYDFEQGETMRIILLRLSPTIHFLVFGSHSLVMDGQSFTLLMQDLQKYYSSSDPVRKTRPFLDYSKQQRLGLSANKFDSQLQYWKNELAEIPPALPILPLSKTASRQRLTTCGNERSELRIRKESKDKIQILCRQYRTTPFHFYLAVLRVLLSRYANTDKLSIGIANANRPEDDMNDSVGVFMNMLPLGFYTDTATPFEELLRETRDKTYAAMSNSDIPFQVILNELDIPRSDVCMPVFNCFMDYRLGQREKVEWTDCSLELHSFKIPRLAYDIALDLIDDPGGDCLIQFIVRNDLYSQRNAEQLARSFEFLVTAFVTKPQSVLDEPRMFEFTDIEQVIKFSQGPVQKSCWPETLIHRIDEVAKTSPYEPAVRYDDETVTYEELSGRISAIAVALQTAGIVLGLRVAVLQEPTPAWIASIFAIMSLGAIYVPLDLGNPWERLSCMVNDSQPSLVLVDDDTRQHVARLCAPNLDVIDVSSVGGQRLRPIRVTSASEAAILYTSGSTGVPKGIILRHEGLRNWVESTVQVYDLGHEIVLQQSSSGFDVSLAQLFTALCSGGSVCLVPRRLRGDAQAIVDLLHSQGITYTIACTSEYFSWFKYAKMQPLSRTSWKTAIVGGEPVTESLLRQFAHIAKTDLRLFNAYGPTEASITATTMELDYRARPSDIAAGYPLPNYSIYVLGQDMRPVPPGMQGEIYIGGAGIATGYMNNQSLTRKFFIPNDFATPEYHARSWTTIHRSGDMGRWREDGALLVEGRVSGDTQIKLRGMRIDICEIENVIVKKANGALSRAIISVHESSTERHQFLVAHVVFEDSVQINDRAYIIGSLQANLGLPQYMCPSVIVPLDNIPMTTTFKLDRKAVGALTLPSNLDASKVDLTDIESRLKRVWVEVIPEMVTSSNNIGPKTDFFHVGGTSLLLLSLRARIQTTFNTDIPLIQMFGSSTLASMAQMLESKTQKSLTLPQIDWDKEAELSPALLEAGVMKLVTDSRQKVVVLTGSTGYLGQALLEALVTNPEVERVHCIAVRNAHSRSEMLDQAKVSVHEGDLLLPHLGLSEQEEKDIFGTAHLIIHNGADVSYMKTYASLRLPNLQSTKELAEMCLPRLVPLHYVSTSAVCSFAAAAGLQQVGPVSVAPYHPPTDGSQGYAASKWASEVFLEKLQARYPQWGVWIHRPSHIARVDAPTFDIADNIRRYSRLLRAVPSMGGQVQGHVDWVSLDSVVAGIMDYCMASDNSSHCESTGPRFLHHISGVGLSFDSLHEWTTEDGGLGTQPSHGKLHIVGLQEMPMRDWAILAAKHGMHPAVGASIQSLADQGQIVFPRLVKFIDQPGKRGNRALEYNN